jgi:hypothetical protein
MSKRARCRENNPSRRGTRKPAPASSFPRVQRSALATAGLLHNRDCLKIPSQASHFQADGRGIPLTWLSDA